MATENRRESSERRKIEREVERIRRRLNRVPVDFEELVALDRKFGNFWIEERKGVI